MTRNSTRATQTGKKSQARDFRRHQEGGGAAAAVAAVAAAAAAAVAAAAAAVAVAAVAAGAAGAVAPPGALAVDVSCALRGRGGLGDDAAAEEFLQGRGVAGDDAHGRGGGENLQRGRPPSPRGETYLGRWVCFRGVGARR
eukprot:GHVT01030348.1.p1 GENE.GHVT01030348.1~~GHVT01030348.1.p1  ORF type:complete len:141 (-),score=47.51 GHVT01030348.1:200-622(-)